MVIGGKIRGNAPQLADYLLTLAENERITIMDVDGRQDADQAYLKDMLYSMELNSELTRSSNSVYHAYINPNPTDTTDRTMTMEEWQKSVDILTEQLGYEDQRRVVVLHEKPNNRVHAHVVYERYNHERGVMATYEHNYKAHDRARAEMEQVLEHKPTPQKNKNRDRHKQTLTEIWQRTNTAQEFISEAQMNGYKIAKGTDRPFRVIDENGVSFDLVRKLDGVKTKEVRERFGDTELIPEKQAIREMQSAKHEQAQQQDKEETKQPVEQTEAKPVQQTAQDVQREELKRKFMEQLKDVRTRTQTVSREITMCVIIALRVGFSFKQSAAKQNNPLLKQQFIACAQTITKPPDKQNDPLLKQQFVANAQSITEIRKLPDKILGFIKAAKFYKPT